MRKNRNSFFTEANMNYNIPNPNGMPYQMGANYNAYMQGPGQYVDSNSVENRLAKLERQVNRLTSRVSKLENVNTTYLDDTDSTGNMYML